MAVESNILGSNGHNSGDQIPPDRPTLESLRAENDRLRVQNGLLESLAALTMDELAITRQERDQARSEATLLRRQIVLEPARWQGFLSEIEQAVKRHKDLDKG